MGQLCLGIKDLILKDSFYWLTNTHTFATRNKYFTNKIVLSFNIMIHFHIEIINNGQHV